MTAFGRLPEPLRGISFLVSGILLTAFAGTAQSPLTAEGFEVSFTAGERDAAGAFMGGTEMRNLLSHGGKLYAGNGYWEDRPGHEGRQPPQLLVLDEARGRWRVERNFDERLPGRGFRHLAVSALVGVTFATDAAGGRLPRPVSLLLAGTWDLSGLSEVFVRDDANGQWSASTLPVGRVRSGIQQVRALGTHRDRVTGVDHVFAGNDRFGIYRGAYDAGTSGHIRWSQTPELDVPTASKIAFSGLSLPRVSGFAECNGELYAAVGQQIWRRRDGPAPRWEILYTNPKPGHSETGLRGLTAVANPAGAGQVLLAAVEGTIARVVRIDPATGQETTELDLQAFVGRAWQSTAGYMIAAYNDMTVLADQGGDTRLLFGIETFVPAKAPVPTGHSRVEGLDGGGWYVVRQGAGRYELRGVGAFHPSTGRPLVATRTIALSPFADAPNLVYFGGYDANKKAAHDTAWILRGDLSKVGEAR